jgi:hypothetical protein
LIAADDFGFTVTTDRHSTAVHDAPAYRASEAAHILALPFGTVQAWSFGHDYRHADGKPKRLKRVIEPADVRHKLFSFAIADRFDAGDPIDEMASDYRVSPRQIEQAIRFERQRGRRAA